MKLLSCIGLRCKHGNDMIDGAAIGTHEQLHGHAHLPAALVCEQVGDATFLPYPLLEGEHIAHSVGEASQTVPDQPGPEVGIVSTEYALPAP